MAHLHSIIFISSESSFQALQSDGSTFQHLYIILIIHRLQRSLVRFLPKFIKKKLDHTKKKWSIQC